MELLYLSDIQRKSFHTKEEPYVSDAKQLAERLCAEEEYSPTCIPSCFRNYKKGIIYYLNNEPYAFTIWRIEHHIRSWNMVFEEYYEMEVSLFYAKDSDVSFLGLLLHDIEQIAVARGIAYITIIPETNALETFCKANGFILTNSMIRGNILIKSMDPSRPLGTSPWRPHVRRIQTRRQPKV